MVKSLKPFAAAALVATLAVGLILGSAFQAQAAKITLAMGLPVKPIIKSTVFKQFCGGEQESEYANVIGKLGRSGIGAILDYSVEGTEDETGFEATKRELLKIIEKSKTNPDIPCTCMKMTAIGPFELYQKVSANEALPMEDQREWDKVRIRLETICEASVNADKPIYIDAEESWVQGAMDSLAEEMMVKYNKQKAIVFTTMQMYRWDRIAYLEQLIADFHERDLPAFTRREARLPQLAGKVYTVIGMRRAGKTWFVFQAMADLLAAGVPKTALLYLNLEDDRLLPMSLAAGSLTSTMPTPATIPSTARA